MEKETRKERFAKYRREIKSTPDDKFPNSANRLVVGGDRNSLSLADKSTFALSYGEGLSALTDITHFNSENGESPYQHFLKAKRNRFIFKCVLFVLAVIGMTIWYVLLSKRS